MARQRVVMGKTGRVLLGLLTLAVSGYLLPLSQVQFAHDLLEISIHRELARDGQSVRPSGPAARTHDCHSCLANHPGASVFSAPEGARFVGPRSDGHLAPAFVNSSAFRIAESPNKRSPPHRLA